MNDKTNYYINGVSALTPVSQNLVELLAKATSSIGFKQTEFSSTENRPQKTDLSGLYDFISKRKLRRLDHFSRLSLYGASLALDDAGLFDTDLTRTGLAVASCYGTTNTNFAFLDSFLDDGDKLASPTHFSSSLHNAAPSYISMLCKTHGPAVTTSNSSLGVAYALLQAMSWLDEGIVDNVIVGGVEEYSPILAHCIEDAEKAKDCLGEEIISGTFLGEGAGFFILSKEKQDNTYCSISRPIITAKDEINLSATGKAFISPIGMVKDSAQYEAFCQNHAVSDLSLVLSYHPSALALSVVCGAYEVKEGVTQEACALAFGKFNGAGIALNK